MKKFLLTVIIFFIAFTVSAVPNSIDVGTITPESTIASGDIKVSAAVPNKIYIKIGSNRIILRDLNYFEAFLTNFQQYVSIVTENNTTVVVRKQIGIHHSRNYMTSSFAFRTNGSGGADSCYLIWYVSDMGHGGGAYHREVVILNNEEVDTLLSYFREAKSELQRMNNEISKFQSEKE